MPAYRLDLAYDGSGFRGYARQPNVRTVQGVLEEALFRHTGVVSTVVAGRTDAGVHASRQVVSFACDVPLDVDLVARSINHQLGGEVAVTGLEEVGDGFNARFSATGRRYEYRLWNAPAPNPFLRTRAWHVPAPLDLTVMQQACAPLLGTQDFASMCRRAEGRSTFRMVRSAEWARPEPHLLVFDIEASSFCHQMVRSIVAVLADIGTGRLLPEDMEMILSALNRLAGRGVAPAHGLTLVDVTY